MVGTAQVLLRLSGSVLFEKKEREKGGVSIRCFPLDKYRILDFFRKMVDKLRRKCNQIMNRRKSFGTGPVFGPGSDA